ncbi:MAG: metallophosphoesterase, partial [Mesorhizobium sp.]
MAEQNKTDRKANGNGKVKIAAMGDLHVQEDAQTSYR